MPDPIRCGRISYINDLPIYAAFDEGVAEFPGQLVSDVPTRLNQAVLSGRLEMGPMSAAQYARHADELVLLDDPCIGTRGDVWSVLLVSPTPPQLLDGVEIAVTRDSASGRALLQILLERRYGVRAAFSTTDDALYAAKMHQPALIIGDPALEARSMFHPSAVYDLGRLWNDWTDADMVFAVWVARRDVYESRRDEVDEACAAIERAKHWGMGNLDRVVAGAQRFRQRPEGFYEAYYTQALNFDLDLSARAGLARYIAELDGAGLMPGVLGHPAVWRVAS